MRPALIEKLKEKKSGKREPIGNQPQSRSQDSDSMLHNNSGGAVDVNGDTDRRGSLGTPKTSRHTGKRALDMAVSPSCDRVVSMPMPCVITIRATSPSAAKNQQAPLQSLFTAQKGTSGAPAAAASLNTSSLVGTSANPQMNSANPAFTSGAGDSSATQTNTAHSRRPFVQGTSFDNDGDYGATSVRMSELRKVDD